MPRRRATDSGEYEPIRSNSRKVPVWAILLIMAVGLVVLVGGVTVAGTLVWVGRQREAAKAAEERLATVRAAAVAPVNPAVAPAAPKPVVVVDIQAVLGNLERNEARNASLDEKRCRFWVRFQSLKKGDAGKWVLAGRCGGDEEPDAIAELDSLDRTTDLQPGDNILIEGEYAGRITHPKPAAAPGYNPYPSSLRVTGHIPMAWRGYAVKFTSAKVAVPPEFVVGMPPVTLGELRAAMDKRNKGDVLAVLGNPLRETENKKAPGYPATTASYFPNTVMIDDNPIPGKTVELVVVFENDKQGSRVQSVAFLRR